MNWKHVAVIALAAVFAISACKKKKEEPKTEPAPVATDAGAPVEAPPAADAAVAPAADAAPAPAADAAPAPAADAAPAAAPAGDACAAYMDGMMKCAKEMSESAAAGSWTADVEKAWRDANATTCDAYKAAGEEALKALTVAMDKCKDKPCNDADPMNTWMACVGTEQANALTAAAMAAAGAVP